MRGDAVPFDLALRRAQGEVEGDRLRSARRLPLHRIPPQAPSASHERRALSALMVSLSNHEGGHRQPACMSQSN